jgi:hypothetical protein
MGGAKEEKEWERDMEIDWWRDKRGKKGGEGKEGEGYEF